MTKPKASLKDGPHVPPPYDPQHVGAFQALQRGEASAHQQQIALDWLIKVACGTYQFHFYPQERDTAFALGRAFPGQQIVKLLSLQSRRSIHEVPDSTESAG